MTEIGWIDALLSDIRSLIKGSLRYRNTHSYLLGGSCGAGNVSIPMLICTGLELTSALYTGRTEYNMGKKKGKPCYDATRNVKEFICQYFPEPIKMFTRIFWDATRNGTHHLFVPKSMAYSNKRVEFMFYVDRVSKKSHVTKSRNYIKININSIEFYRVFKKAFEDYKTKITLTPRLRKNFMLAWRSIKPRVLVSPNDMATEATDLSNKLRKNPRFDLFPLVC
jgi:hypothetical protein